MDVGSSSTNVHNIPFYEEKFVIYTVMADERWMYCR